MRVQLVDPPAYTPPYDRALCAALARAGAEVELVTSRFEYGPVPEAEGYAVREAHLRRSARRGPQAALRRPRRAAEHLGDMWRERRRARHEGYDLRHYQWLPAGPLDRLLLPRDAVPRVLTVHDPLPEDAGRLATRAWRATLSGFDALVVHSERAASSLVLRGGVDREQVEVVPHGAFEHLARQPSPEPLPAELAAVEGPVVLMFGLIRPYKGVEVLLRAFAEVPGAELWIVGMPRMDMGPIEELARRCPGAVRIVSRFITDPEIPAYFERADVVALPYLEADQSGVLHTALAFGSPLVLSDVGGFAEVAAHGAARLVPPGEPGPLATALRELTGADGERERRRLAAAARAAAQGPYSWDRAAEAHLALYRGLLEARRQR